MKIDASADTCKVAFGLKFWGKVRSAAKAAPGANPASGRDAVGAQPEPTGLILNQIHTGATWVTSITREWASAKAARGRCRLCPRADCVVSPRGVCNVMVVGKVDEDDAWLYAHPDAPAPALADLS